MEAPPIQRFEGVSIVASDIAATLHFWCDFVGGEIVGEGTVDGTVPWRIGLGGAVVEIYQQNDVQAPSPGAGNQHFCWDIEPVDVDWWMERGLSWKMRPIHVSMHHNGLELSLFWDDPDGYHFEIAAHYCTDLELVKARESRMARIRELLGLPSLPFTIQTGPAREPALVGV